LLIFLVILALDVSALQLVVGSELALSQDGDCG